MVFVTILLILIISGVLLFLDRKAKSAPARFITRFLLYALLVSSEVIIISELIGLHWPSLLQIAALAYICAYLLWATFLAAFWGKLVYQFVLIYHLALGGYLYTAAQIPYKEKPFADISSNQPKILDTTALPSQWILGLPLVAGKNQEMLTYTVSTRIPARRTSGTHQSRSLQWSDVEPLMQKDSRIHDVLENLRKHQDRELSETLANLNTISVTNTKMRRHGLDRNKVDDLLKESAISSTNYRTILETWKLLDEDERAFRGKQSEFLFHALVELLEDDKIEESYKVDFINFMVGRCAGDVRLIKPLINLYARLDEDYPRQKRLNQKFLDLYIAKRNAILHGLKTIGTPALQHLLDYRKKTISHITYSQARLDIFLQRNYGIHFRPLYGVLEPQAIPVFLNRQKYPPLQKLAGASFGQEFIRLNQVKIANENKAPALHQAVMGLSPEAYRNIRQTVKEGYPDKLDYLVIYPDPAVRGNLAWHLAGLKDPYLLPLIFELMRDPHPEVRRLATIAVGNFKILDIQGSNDQKFIEIVRLLQNYRSNSDAYSRAWAMLALASVGDKQKALYIIDLILNDGASSNSILGDAAPTWSSEEEKHVVQSLGAILKKTPEELSVKIQALNALIAIDSPEALDILLHYLHHIYTTYHTRPSMWRYIVPHMTLPQEAENVEDIITYLAKTNGPQQEQIHKRHLKALHMYLGRSYEDYRSGEFFQFLRFLQEFDPVEYQDYLDQNQEYIRLMRVKEYTLASYPFWLVFWPMSLAMLLLVNYVLFPLLKINIGPDKQQHTPNQRSNPASDHRNLTVAPPSTIVPVKIASRA